MRQLAMAAILIMLVVPAAALEVPFHDGSSIDAVSYTVNGSYLMLEMPNGARVAYDVADIDLAALREAEAAAAGDEVAASVPEPSTLGVTGSLQVPDEGETGGLTITDQHVKHVSGSGIGGPEDDGTAESPDDADAVPDGYEEGGGVLLNNVTVTPLEGGQWQVKGEVVNRSKETVLDVRANLQAAMPEGDPWTASVGVTGLLGPDEKATFTHTFAAPDAAGDGWMPNIQVSVVWMRGESRLEPNYDRLAPHPSALPYDRGETGGTTQPRKEVPL